MSRIGEEVVQGGSHISGYTTALYKECGVMYGLYLIGDKHVKDHHGFTSNYTPDMLSYQPAGCYQIYVENCISTKWYGGQRKILEIWICHANIVGLLNSACIMDSRHGTCHASRLQPQPHLIHASQLLHWFSD